MLELTEIQTWMTNTKNNEEFCRLFIVLRVPHY